MSELDPAALFAASSRLRSQRGGILDGCEGQTMSSLPSLSPVTLRLPPSSLSCLSLFLCFVLISLSTWPRHYVSTCKMFIRQTCKGPHRPSRTVGFLDEAPRAFLRSHRSCDFQIVGFAVSSPILALSPPPPPLPCPARATGDFLSLPPICTKFRPDPQTTTTTIVVH